MISSPFRRTFFTVVLGAMLFVLPVVIYGKTIWSTFSSDAGDIVGKQIPQALGIPTPTPAQEWLSTRGNAIVNEHGETVILKGINMSGVNWGDDTKQWYPRAVEYAVKTLGVQVVRTRITQDEYVADPAFALSNLEKLIIGPARKNGAYVILHPWIHHNDSLPDAGTVQMWREIAQKYKDDPAILYDVLPEPHDVPRESLYKGYGQIIEAVRAVNPRALIFVTGLAWGREINSYLENPLPYPNIVYRSNPYNRAGEFESLFGRIAKVYPVFLGEFGADGYPPMSREDVRSLLSYANTLGIGWTAWNFHSEGCPCMLSDFVSFTPTAYGQIVFDALRQNAAAQGRSLASAFPLRPETIRNDQFAVVYKESLQNAFIDESWGTETDLLSSENVYQGEHAMRVRFTQGGGSIVLHTYNPVGTRSYDSLRFFINFGSQQPFKMLVGVTESSDQTLRDVELGSYLTPIHQDWFEVSIPLKDLDVTGKKIEKIVIQNRTQPRETPIYIDDMAFVSAK